MFRRPVQGQLRLAPKRWTHDMIVKIWIINSPASKSNSCTCSSVPNLWIIANISELFGNSNRSWRRHRITSFNVQTAALFTQMIIDYLPLFRLLFLNSLLRSIFVICPDQFRIMLFSPSFYSIIFLSSNINTSNYSTCSFPQSKLNWGVHNLTLPAHFSL